MNKRDIQVLKLGLDAYASNILRRIRRTNAALLISPNNKILKDKILQLQNDHLETEHVNKELYNLFHKLEH